MLEFDADTARLLEAAYQGGDFRRRRQASFDALAPEPGETILDIGAGNGFLSADLARAVGERGRVLAVDPSADMRATAERLWPDMAQIEWRDGLAGALPVQDESVDRAVAVQVLEYVPDLAGAIADAMRCLKPDGRLVLSDMHGGTLVWSSDDPDRMAGMMASWDRHYAHPDSPAQMTALIKTAGHAVDRVIPFVTVDHTLRPDGMARMLLALMRHYALANDHVCEADVTAWREEQLRRAEEGRFFFSFTQFIVVARKTG